MDGLLQAFEAGDPTAVKQINQRSKQHPALLRPYAGLILEILSRSEHWLVRASVCEMLPRLRLTPDQHAQAFDLLRQYQHDKSRIVRTFAMQTMFDLSADDEALREEAIAIAGRALHHGTAAMKARARHLLKPYRMRS